MSYGKEFEKDGKTNGVCGGGDGKKYVTFLPIFPTLTHFSLFLLFHPRKVHVDGTPLCPPPEHAPKRKIL